MEKEKQEKIDIIRKSNELIEKSRYELTITHQRLILYTISKIKSTDEDFKKYEILVKDLIEKTESSTALYIRLKKEVEDLMKKTLTIIKPTGWIVLNWFSSVEYKENEGKIITEFSPELKPYLLQLKEKYTEYMLKYVLPMRSSYAVQIYELLKQYEKLQKDQIEKWRYFDLDEFKKLMMIENKKTYQLYGNIKDKILKVSQKEINIHTDIFITNIEEKRLKRDKVVGFTVFFKKKQDKIPHFDDLTTIDDQKLKKFLSYIPEEKRTTTIENILIDYINKGYAEDYIISNIQYTLQHNPETFSGYLFDALQKDYAKDQREVNKIQKEKDSRGEIEKEQKRIEELKVMWWRNKILQEKNKLAEEEKRILEEKANEMVNQIIEQDNIKDQTIIKHLKNLQINILIRENLEQQGIKPPEKIEDLQF